MRTTLCFLALAPVILALAGCTTVEPRPPAAPVQLGTVTVLPDSRTVVATGFVNQVKGLVELAACGPQGKTHESVFVLQVNAIDLQTGLLLIGAKAGKPMEDPTREEPQGSPLSISYEWEQDGQVQTRKLGESLIHTTTRRPMADASWVFTGSAIEDGQFRANGEGCLIVTYRDPWAIVNLGGPLGSDDEVIAANAAALPPVKTPVRLLFRLP